MTVQELFNAAARRIGDYINITDYNTDYFDYATQIVSELMRKKIGVKPTEYFTETGTAPYTPSDTDYQPIALPDDLTLDDQIIGIEAEEEFNHYKTETHAGALYLLIPATYEGDILVRYMPSPPSFTSLSDTIPLTDDAITNVAVWGLAELFSITNAPMHTDRMALKYLQAKAAWRSRDYNTGEVRDVYDLGLDYE